MRLVKQERQKIKRETVYCYHTQSCVIEKKVPFFTYDTLKQKRHKLYFFRIFQVYRNRCLYLVGGTNIVYKTVL